MFALILRVSRTKIATLSSKWTVSHILKHSNNQTFHATSYKDLMGMKDILQPSLFHFVKNNIKFLHDVKRHIPTYRKIINLECEATKSCIDELLLGIGHEQNFRVRDDIYREIEAAETFVQNTSSFESGPSGLYEYYFHGEDMTYMRRSLSSKKEEMVLELTSDMVGPMSLSFDEKFIAYLRNQSNLSADGSDNHNVLIIRQINSGREFIFPPIITNNEKSEDCITNVEFGYFTINDNQQLCKEHGHQRQSIYYDIFFTSKTSALRPNKVWRVRFNDQSLNFAEPEMMLMDENEANFVDISRSKGGKYMIINSTSKTSNEVHIVSPEKSSRLILVRKREVGINYFVDCGNKDDVFIIGHVYGDIKKFDSDHDIGEEISVFETKIKDLPITANFGHKILSAKMVSSETTDKGKASIVEDIDIFENFLVLYERENLKGTQQIRVLSRQQQSSPFLVDVPTKWLGNFPALIPGGNIHFTSKKLYFTASSFVMPDIGFEFDMENKKLTPLTTQIECSVISNLIGLNPVEYIVKKELVRSNDGTMVPVSLVYKENFKAAETFHRPTLLIGYGAYGVSQDMQFDPSLVPLLKRGWAIAIAHTRGGGELGKHWYRRGRILGKEQGIEDFISCARALTDKDGINLTRPAQLAARGYSAGAVMVASSAIIRHPELFAAIVLKAPFLNVLGTLEDKYLPLTQHEFGEWGDPRKSEKINISIQRCCPMNNVEKLMHCPDHPKILIIGSVDDANVPIEDSVEFVSKVRHYRKIQKRDTNDDTLEDKSALIYSTSPSSTNDVYIHIEEDGGHHFKGKRRKIAFLEATFLHGICGIKDWEVTELTE